MLTLDDVKRYLAEQTDPDGSIGEPMTACYCLAACTLSWLYPNSDPVVHISNTNASVVLDGKITTVEFTPEVTAVANKFDRFPERYTEPVTRAELEEYMPELFSTDVE